LHDRQCVKRAYQRDLELLNEFRINYFAGPSSLVTKFLDNKYFK